MGRGLFDPWIFPSIWNEIKHIPPTEREVFREHHGLKKVRATPAAMGDVFSLLGGLNMGIMSFSFGGRRRKHFFFSGKSGGY